jgi:periplasmic divalent cation tolerance protein
MDTYTRLVLSTTSTKEEAERIAHTLVERRLAACVNIVEGVESLFWWQGKLERQKECLLFIKTKQGRIKDVVSCIKELHSYSVPEVISFCIEDGNKDYIEWIGDNVK